MEQKRLISIDTFRGFTIAAMILVNFPGHGDFVFTPLNHTKWWGISFTDLIAPFFLFVVGISITLAYSKRLDAGEKPQNMYPKLIIRSLKIFGVGMLLNVIGIIDHFSWSELRWTGTLHRIAIVFLVCGLLFLYTNWKKQVIIGVLVLIGYWLAMTVIPTPGCTKVMLEPGQNLAAWIDSCCMPGKMWQGTWDPEGILSTFPSIVTGITGMLAGKLMYVNKTLLEKVSALFFFGFLSFIAGIIWNWDFPLNENIWSSSFVLVTSGMASMTIAACIYLIEIKGYQKWAQFGIIYGMNAISVYVLADILAIFFYGTPFGGITLNIHFFNLLNAAGVNNKLASMFYALIYVFINFIPAWLLYRKRIFIKL
ncbi:MAG: heparan-alpha-glucosaminide N-acetyltransferase domain-containing protein [Sediminibacterium sp.]|nr:heparan-alpha-glucosaminide N-acetyltransferase domain-containing protein [Sediminibacterium sp.]